jgi:hypothetical protein
MKDQVNLIASENVRLAAECRESKMERYRRRAEESYNDYALESVTIKNIFPNAERKFCKRYLRFSRVISSAEYSLRQRKID